MINSKKASGVNIIVAIIIGVVILLSFTSLYGNRAIPALLGIYSCKAPNGYCAESCPGQQLEGFSCKNKNDKCCFGESPEEDEEGNKEGNTEGNNHETQINVCPTGKVCWKFVSNVDDPNFHELNEWPYTSCLWDRDATYLNQQNIHFESSIEGAACCKMQLGGISDADFSYFSSGVTSVDGIVEDNVCKVSMDFDFNSITNSQFNVDYWKDSYDTRNYIQNGACSIETNRKAMFKLDFIYWADSADCINKRVDAPSTASKAVLLGITELLPNEEVLSGEPGNEEDLQIG